MSAVGCEDPNHEQCGTCGGCVIDGCLCHLAGEAAEEPEEPLTLDALGLRAFDLHSEERQCPKCQFAQMRVAYHPRIVITVGEAQSFPCGAWALSGILSESVTQHLCLQCMRFGYGYPTKTSDAP